jgi:hypothetical protein
VAAGKHNIGMLSIGGTSDEALKAHASNWSVYEGSARAAGKTPDRRKWRIVTFAHVAETPEQARADVKFGLENFKRYFSEVATFPIIPPDITADSAEYLVASGLACIGTPEDCVRHFERLWQGSNGGFGGVLLLAHNWADWAATKRSYELMARRSSAFPAQRQRAARLELCRRQVQIRDVRRAVPSGGPSRDRQKSAPQGLIPRSDSPISCAWDRGAAAQSLDSTTFLTIE